MNKASSFFKSILPFLAAILLQAAAAVILFAVYAVLWINDGGEISDILSYFMALLSDQDFSQLLNLTYGIITIIVCGIWYRRAFIKPVRKHPKTHPSGFSFHTVISILFLGVGLQYMCALLMDLIGLLWPAVIENYTALIESAGYGNASAVLIFYTVLIAPVSEELIFRGLTYRYARIALPFVLANIWQALLFGVIHMNIAQGIYAFGIGLVLGWLVHRGHGIKYSIAAHIVFNILGCFFSGFFEMTAELNYTVSMVAGAILTVFALWLFYTDFRSADK